MATFRKIHTSFWNDPFIENLDKDKKLFYLYLMTNNRTTQCGIYEISKKQISYDLGYSINTVSILLQYFIDNKKIKYNDKTNEVALKNWAKYNESGSPKVKSCIEKELKLVKDRVLIEYLYSIDTESQEEEEEEKKEEEKNNKIPLCSDCENYFFENGFKKELGKNFFDFYNCNNWEDSKGNKVKRWKQKAQYWFNNNKDQKNTIDVYKQTSDNKTLIDLSKITNQDEKNKILSKICKYDFIEPISGVWRHEKANYRAYLSDLNSLGEENVKFLEYVTD